MLLIRKTIIVEIDDDKYDQFGEDVVDKACDRIEENLDTHIFNFKTDVNCMIKDELQITVKVEEI